MKDVIKWLSPLENQTRHRDVCSKRLENTGDWFLELPVFQEWRDGNGPGARDILCCYAIPGAGKTFMR